MKKSLLISSIVVATAAFVFSSCDSRLDVLPTQTLETGASLKTVKDLQAYLVGCYDGLQTGGDTYSGGFMYTSELLGNDGVEFRFGGTFSNLLEIDSKAITRTNSTAENTWVRAYNTINRCNTILANLDKTTDKIEPETKDLFEGEASFIRGAIYFELTRLYGKQWGDGDNAANPSVPLVTTPTTVITDAESRPRANVAAIYAQVISDLTKAEAKLPAKNGFFVNKWAASGLLARVYLQQGNYMAARDAASKVIESAQFSLTKAFKDAFNSKLTNNGSNPSEYIFAVQVSDQDGTNGMNTFFGTTLTSVPGTSGRGDMRILAPHIALYDSLDVRGKF